MLTTMMTLAFMLAQAWVSPPVQATAAACCGEGVVRATGIGRAPAGLTGPQARLMAERAARIVACRNLLAEQGRGSVQEQGGGWCQVRVAGVLSGHRYLPTTYRPDGTAVVTVELAEGHQAAVANSATLAGAVGGTEPRRSRSGL